MMVMRFIDKVFDCWLDSEYIPYMQNKYPSENKEWFEGGFTANLTAEVMDQKRVWLYNFMIVNTALFNNTYLNTIILNRIVFPRDWNNMSKRYNNYPDINLSIKQYGADDLHI